MFPIILKTLFQLKKPKSNECTSSLVCDKSTSKISYSLENCSSTQKSKPIECTLSLGCDKSISKVSNNLKKTLLQLANRIQTNVLRH